MNASGISTNMAAFEKVFEDLDVNVESMTGALDTVTGQSAADQNEVAHLLAQLQAEAGLEAGLDIKNAAQTKLKGPQAQVAEKDELDDLEKRLAALQ